MVLANNDLEVSEADQDVPVVAMAGRNHDLVWPVVSKMLADEQAEQSAGGTVLHRDVEERATAHARERTYYMVQAGIVAGSLALPHLDMYSFPCVFAKQVAHRRTVRCRQSNLESRWTSWEL